MSLLTLRATVEWRTWIVIGHTVCLLLLGSRAAPGAEAQNLRPLLQPIIEAHDGDVAVMVRHLETGESFSHRPNTVMPTASLIKLSVMVTAYHLAANGKANLAEMLELSEDDKVPGSGILTAHFSPGAKLSLRDAIRLMIAFSDNTATNLVAKQIGIAATKEYMASLGLTQTRLNSFVYRRDTSIDPQRSAQFGLGTTTAAEMVELLSLLNSGKVGSQADTQEMLAHLKACQEKNMLTRFLPADVEVAHKSGAIAAARCAAGIIDTPSGPIALCVLTANNADQSWQPDNAAQRLCADIGLAVHTYFSSDEGEPQGEIPSALARGATGETVQTLQRTLNARLNPSPGLAIDGDFGPATEAAVKKFQEGAGLETTGRVDQQVWKALAPLVNAEPPVPEPEAINSEKLPTAPADSLDGPPFTSCKAWAIADASTGELLFSQDAEVQLDFASTTKIMTGHLICQLANEHPNALDEVITFSKRADDMIGSTAGIRVGEKVAVRDLLYGLMLPSGNDASIAFAEHFGGRLAGSEADSREANYNLFLQAMNAEAERLGMTNTHYENPHGMTATEHKTTAADLLILAHAAMRDPLFRKVVATRQHGVKVSGASGYERNVRWTNTNRLLEIEGYVGIKTGTTDAAGACLVSAARRGDQSLLLCVLGSSSSSARYVDSRNLYRWTWQQRAPRQTSEE